MKKELREQVGDVTSAPPQVENGDHCRVVRRAKWADLETDGGFLKGLSPGRIFAGFVPRIL